MKHNLHERPLLSPTLLLRYAMAVWRFALFLISKLYQLDVLPTYSRTPSINPTDSPVFEPCGTVPDEFFTLGITKQYERIVTDKLPHGNMVHFGFGTDFNNPDQLHLVSAVSHMFVDLLIVKEQSRMLSGTPLGYDPRVVFENARFCGAPVVAIYYACSRQHTAARYFSEAVLTWAAAHPTGYGIHWVNAMEPALRVANWCIGYRVLVDCSAIDDSIIKRIERAILEHGFFIAGHLEKKGSVRNNHYLANLTGLIYIGTLVGNLRNASKWKNFAIKELQIEITHQFLGDGCAFESSTCYHAFSAELLLFCAVIAVQAHPQFSGENYTEVCDMVFGKPFTARLKQIIGTFKLLLKPDGTLPQIGDNDSGHLHDCFTRSSLDAHHLLAMGSVFFGEPSFKIREHGECSEIRLFMGSKGANYYKKIDGISIAEIHSGSFTHAGWHILRKESDYCCISTGINDSTYSFHHAHNDALGFELTLRGRPVFCDPGSYCYLGNAEARNRFRSTHMHNTLCIDTLEQNELSISNIFALHRTISIGECRIVDIDDVATFSGSVSYSGCCHRRSITYEKSSGTFTFRDSFTAPPTAKVKELRFHLHPDLHFSDKSIVISQTGDAFAKCQFESSSHRIEHYDYSPVFGKKIEAECLVINVDDFEDGHQFTLRYTGGSR